MTFVQYKVKKKVTRTFVSGTIAGVGARNAIYMLLNVCVLSPGEMCTTV